MQLTGRGLCGHDVPAEAFEAPAEVDGRNAVSQGPRPTGPAPGRSVPPGGHSQGLLR